MPQITERDIVLDILVDLNAFIATIKESYISTLYGLKQAGACLEIMLLYSESYSCSYLSQDAIHWLEYAKNSIETKSPDQLPIIL